MPPPIPSRHRRGRRRVHSPLAPAADDDFIIRATPHGGIDWHYAPPPPPLSGARSRRRRIYYNINYYEVYLILSFFHKLFFSSII